MNWDVFVVGDEDAPVDAGILGDEGVFILGDAGAMNCAPTWSGI